MLLPDRIKKGRVSAIIPAYNGVPYITQAVESVFNQTYTDYEIIVVDDGSTDDTLKVLEPYFDRIRYLYQENQGVATARNRGFQIARGEFIVFLDQDDFFLPDKLAVQVAHLEANPSLGLVNSGWQIVDERGKEIGGLEPWQVIDNLDLRGWVLWKPVFLGAMMFRHEWLARSGGFDTKLQQAPDVALTLALALMGCPSDWVRQYTVAYRQHDANTSLNSLQQAQEMELVLDEFFHQPNLPVEVKQLESQSRYLSLVWNAWRLYHTGNIVEMADYLEKAFNYRINSPMATVLHWIECFKTCALQYGYEIDTYALSNCDQWKSLMKRCVVS